MNYKFKKSIKSRILCIILTLCMAFAGIISIPNSEPVNAQQDSSNYKLADDIQDGVILHCFNWTYNDIKAELPNIAAAGFTSVQTSPAQPSVNSGVWYWLYQPLGFYVANNDIGTKEELRSLCEEADKYGIKVIVDVVANHLAGDHSNIQGDLKDGQFWHHYGEVTDWTDRYQVTHGEIGMPDINSEHSYVQQCVSNYINELKSLGVDGIRWDAAKHISLPSEGCNFWPAVTSQGLYHYGEILVGPDDRKTGNEGLMKEYTNYITVTDSNYGKDLREAFASGKAPEAYGNWSARGISNDKLIYWGESHDTWSNNQDWGYSNGMSQNVIDRAYAVAASRNGVSALYFSRPASTNKESIRAGQKGSTHFTSIEVAAVNHFHNAMIGQPDYYTTGNNCAVVTRNTGAVIVAGSGGNFSVSVPNGGSLAEPGTYVDEITGEKWTVTSTTITGKIGSSGIAVIYKDGVTPPPTEKGTVYYKNTNNWNNVYAYYWSDSNKNMTTWPGVPMTSIGNNEYSVEIPKNATNIIFSNQGSSKTDDLDLPGMDMIYNNGSWSKYGSDPIKPTIHNIYYKNTSNWSNVYAYYWSDSNTKMTTWPGVQMTSVGDNSYGTSIPEDAKYIIFNNGSGTKTDDLTLAGLNKIYNNGSWSDYGNGTIIPIDKNIYYKNTNNWNSVYAYYWSDSNTKMTTWPGVQMTSVGNGTYKIEVPSDAKYIIFNNGNGSQTVDITLNGTGMIYNNGSWSSYS
ncbi:MAG: starch-binding protein [Lachnospiraceae bacterium]|nr:starch-binding protein [Lachnospiraceae bacterium]